MLDVGDTAPDFDAEGSVRLDPDPGSDAWPTASSCSTSTPWTFPRSAAPKPARFATAHEELSNRRCASGRGQPAERREPPSVRAEPFDSFPAVERHAQRRDPKLRRRRSVWSWGEACEFPDRHGEDHPEPCGVGLVRRPTHGFAREAPRQSLRFNVCLERRQPTESAWQDTAPSQLIWTALCS